MKKLVRPLLVLQGTCFLLLLQPHFRLIQLSRNSNMGTQTIVQNSLETTDVVKWSRSDDISL